MAKLKAAKRAEATDHRRVHRPWGYYESIDAGDRFQIKRIVVIPGGVLSLQKHRHRAEHWVVVRGTAEVTINDMTRDVLENESIYIPIGSVHRLTNQGRIRRFASRMHLRSVPKAVLRVTRCPKSKCPAVAGTLWGAFHGGVRRMRR
jgi:mannose-6-phosphate isomerase-like protein (cupin superfamily)